MESKNLSKKISRNEFFSQDSQKIAVKGNQSYETSANVIGNKGQSYSTYFSVILLDSSEREIERRIRWITDFTKKKTNYKLIFKTTPETKNVVLGYRCNIETPVKTDLDVELQVPSSLTIKETTLEHVSDDITQYEVPFLQPLSTEDEEILEKKIIWLCAPPRSGTTWLGTQLLNHNDNIIWHEPWLGLHLGVLRGVLVPSKNYEQNNYRFERVFDTQAKEGEYFFSPHHKNNWLPMLRKLILARTYSHAQTLTKNIIIKDPVGSNGVDMISQCLPNSKILFLIRDGRDEVDSRMDMHRPDSWAKLRPFRDDKDRLDAINYYSQLWVVNMKNIKIGFDKHDSKLKLMLKYEDLKANTVLKLKEIYDFINLSINETELKKIINQFDFTNIPEFEKGDGKFKRTAKLGGWRKNFNEKEIEVMNSILGKTLREFGYKLD